ncbi:MAG TPA: hypothetical protein VFU38_07925 [Candidatus Krumholzibacteria bacterium]|nr:hypothetical protein [Candidatus Krumholzibacteria bacterium]
MKYAAFLFLSLAAVIACSEDRIDSPAEISNRPAKLESGTVVVFVYWQGEGVPDKRVELLELGIERTTNADGLAEFKVPVGKYTVRVYDINRGGPALWYVDEPVTVTRDEETRVDVFDCLACV